MVVPEPLLDAGSGSGSGRGLPRRWLWGRCGAAGSSKVGAGTRDVKGTSRTGNSVEVDPQSRSGLQ